MLPFVCQITIFFITFPNGMQFKGTYNKKYGISSYSLSKYSDPIWISNVSVEFVKREGEESKECANIQNYEPSRVWIDYSPDGPTTKQMLNCLNSFTEWDKMPKSALEKIYEQVIIYFPEA